MPDVKKLLNSDKKHIMDCLPLVSHFSIIKCNEEYSIQSHLSFRTHKKIAKAVIEATYSNKYIDSDAIKDSLIEAQNTHGLVFEKFHRNMLFLLLFLVHCRVRSAPLIHILSV